MFQKTQNHNSANNDILLNLNAYFENTFLGHSYMQQQVYYNLFKSNKQRIKKSELST